jgi:transcriptional regulator with XRE-family HTH domain
MTRNANLGTEFRVRRKGRGLTQQQAADLAGVSVSYLGRIERGLQRPSWDIYWRLVAVYNGEPSHSSA